MTWYFNNDGLADGPYEDEAMSALLVQKRIKAQTLVWHDGAAEWQELAAMEPAWWQAVAATLAPAPSTQPLKTIVESGTRNLLPKAPREEAKPAETGNFLKRLFGFGKK